MTTPAENSFLTSMDRSPSSAPVAPAAPAESRLTKKKDTMTVASAPPRPHDPPGHCYHDEQQNWPHDEPPEIPPDKECATVVSAVCRRMRSPEKDKGKKDKKDDTKKGAVSTLTTTSLDDDMKDDDDPFAIESRFYRPHLHHFQNAVEEIRQGQKESHWMWYLVPTPPYLIDGVEVGSSMNRRYALRSDQEVISYLQFNRPDVDLRQNYVDLAKAIVQQLEDGNPLPNMFRYGDHKKVLSSITLFERVGTQLGDQELFVPCRRILELVEKHAARRPTKNHKSFFSMRKNRLASFDL